MLARLVCWLIGHKRFYRNFIEWAKERDGYLYELKPYPNCPRCGAMLSGGRV